MTVNTQLMQGKTVLVTGATSGIGQETAIGLAKMGAQVIITGRNRQRGQAAVREIQQASGNPKINLMIADMTSQADIESITVKKHYERCDEVGNEWRRDRPRLH